MIDDDELTFDLEGPWSRSIDGKPAAYVSLATQNANAFPWLPPCHRLVNKPPGHLERHMQRLRSLAHGPVAVQAVQIAQVGDIDLDPFATPLVVGAESPSHWSRDPQPPAGRPQAKPCAASDHPAGGIAGGFAEAVAFSRQADPPEAGRAANLVHPL